ncbi:MAG: FeoB small GTPase domain-containing protein, partial [Opitutales bacterium]
MEGEKKIRVALIGNPNTGKTSLFNAMTGLKQRVGNYSGVTVEKKTGTWILNEERSVELIDLPGTYSLSAKSIDERIAVDVLSGNLEGDSAPDLVVVVVDVENLQRNLFLASQASELDVPMVIALNCWDVAERKGLNIDSKLLEKRLGVPVVPTVANRRRGVDELSKAVADALHSRPKMIRPCWPEPVEESLKLLQTELIENRGENLNKGELMRLLFDRNSAVVRRLKTPEADVKAVVQSAREQMRHGGYSPDAAESLLRFRFLNPLLLDIIERQANLKQQSRSEGIDQILLHRFWGLAVFVGMMYIVFQSVYTWAGPFM